MRFRARRDRCFREQSVAVVNLDALPLDRDRDYQRTDRLGCLFGDGLCRVDLALDLGALLSDRPLLVVVVGGAPVPERLGMRALRNGKQRCRGHQGHPARPTCCRGRVFCSCAASPVTTADKMLPAQAPTPYCRSKRAVIHRSNPLFLTPSVSQRGKRFMSNPKDLGWLRRKCHNRAGACLKLNPM
jgi:hypothetical protein